MIHIEKRTYVHFSRLAPDAGFGSWSTTSVRPSVVPKRQTSPLELLYNVRAPLRVIEQVPIQLLLPFRSKQQACWPCRSQRSHSHLPRRECFSAAALYDGSYQADIQARFDAIRDRRRRNVDRALVTIAAPGGCLGQSKIPIPLTWSPFSNCASTYRGAR
jgi:hypothetical protein